MPFFDVVFLKCDILHVSNDLVLVAAHTHTTTTMRKKGLCNSGLSYIRQRYRAEVSLNQSLEVQAMETQGVKKVLEMAIQQLKKSTLSKNPIQRYRYDGYMAKHYDKAISRHKAQLVVKSYAQTQGINYEETFAPVAKMKMIRSILVEQQVRDDNDTLNMS